MEKGRTTIFLLLLFLFMPTVVLFTGMKGRRLFSEYVAEKDSDWDWQLTFYEVSRKTIGDFREFPFWSPYTRGGLPLLANLESPFLYPLFLPVLLAGTSAGINIMILFHIFLGIAGTLLLSFELGLGVYSMIPPALFLFSSTFHEFFHVGHIMYSGMALLPWIFLFYLRIPETRWGLPLSALSTALTLFMGAHYIFIYAIVMALLYSIFVSVKGKGWQWSIILLLIMNILFAGGGEIPEPFGEGVVILFLVALFLLPRGGGALRREALRFSLFLIFSLLLSSVKLLPASYLFGRSERLVHICSTEAGSPLNIEDLLLRWGGEIEAGAGHEDHGTFFTFLPVALLWAGIAFSMRGAARGVAFIFLFVLNLSLSSNLPFNLTAVIHRAPGLSMIRVNERYFMLYSLFFALLCGIGAKGLARLNIRPLMGWVNPAIILLLALSFGYHLSKLPARVSPFYSHLVRPLEGEREEGGEFFQERGEGSNFESVRMNRGRPDCTTTAPLPASPRIRARGDESYRGEAYLLSGRALERVEVTPNTVRATRGGERGDILILNQNWMPGWSARGSGGEILDVYPWRGLVSVPVPEGVKEVRIRYIAPWFRGGLFLSILGIVGLVLFPVRQVF